MNIVRRLTVPTGDILVVRGDSGGLLECLSLADYGAGVNLNQNKPVPDGSPLMPLTKKWVCTISTQHGCSMGCQFCDVPRVGGGRNASYESLAGQIRLVASLHPEVKETARFNVHFARMGEPTWNPDVLRCARELRSLSMFHPHPVVSTMMPNGNKWLGAFLYEWMRIKNDLYHGDAGLQLSINSTDPCERTQMFSDHALTLDEIARVMHTVPMPIVGRKITLNFALAGYTIDPAVLRRYFNPRFFICKLTPMHKTERATKEGIRTAGDYTSPEPYQETADRLRDAGYEVLVFIASHDEDASRITCGNAILSGTMPHKYKEGQ